MRFNQRRSTNERTGPSSRATELEAKQKLPAEQSEALDDSAAIQEQYRNAFDCAPIGMAVLELDGRRNQVSRSLGGIVGCAQDGQLVCVNAKLCDILGYSSDELRALTFAQLMHPEDMIVSREALEKLRRGELQSYSAEKRCVRKDGRVIWTSLNTAVINQSNGVPRRAVSTILDITSGKHAEQLEGHQRRILEMVAADTPLPDVLGEIASSVEQQVEGAAVGLLLFEDDMIHLQGPGLPADWREAVAPHSLTLAYALLDGAGNVADGCGVTVIERHEVWKPVRPAAARNGIAACWTMGIQAKDSSPLAVLATFCREERHPAPAELQTLSMASRLAAVCIERHNTTRQLSHLVRHDPLTHLPNRLMFDDRVQHALDLARRSGNHVGVMVLDIDKFKTVNDSFGHDAGDQLLQQLADRLRRRLRGTDTMARLGGDEFAVVLPELSARDGAAAVAAKLVESLAEAFEIDGRVMPTTVSIGIATFPDDGHDAATLQKQADGAMYRVKLRGCNGFGY